MVGTQRYAAGLRAMRDRSRVAAVKRLALLIKDSIAALDAATTPLERAKVAGRIYRKGYANGASAAYQRYVAVPRKAAQTRSA